LRRKLIDIKPMPEAETAKAVQLLSHASVKGPAASRPLTITAADKSKVDTLIPKATAVNTELAKPEVEPSRLTKLAGQLGDLQKQYAALKGN